jgi:protein ImuA
MGIWTLGPSESPLGRVSLDLAGVHEVKPAAGGAGERLAALAFALRLAVRRRHEMSALDRRAPILWSLSSTLARELGWPYGPGLAGLGLDPSAVIIVETKRATDTLWVLEEGLKSASLALVLGLLDEVSLTAARRLSLAAKQHLVPCLLLTAAHAPATAATATRWRIAPARTAPHPFDPLAPGASRATVTLERCRNRPAAEAEASLTLEWSDETHRFRVAPLVAHRAHAAPDARRRARR